MSWQSISKRACSGSKVTPSKSVSTPELFSIAHDYGREELWETLKQDFLRWVLVKKNKSCLWLKSIEVRAKRWIWERQGLQAYEGKQPGKRAFGIKWRYNFRVAILDHFRPQCLRFWLALLTYASDPPKLWETYSPLQSLGPESRNAPRPHAGGCKGDYGKLWEIMRYRGEKRTTINI